jgi:hypothetical protein
MISRKASQEKDRKTETKQKKGKKPKNPNNKAKEHVPVQAGKRPKALNNEDTRVRKKRSNDMQSCGTLRVVPPKCYRPSKPALVALSCPFPFISFPSPNDHPVLDAVFVNSGALRSALTSLPSQLGSCFARSGMRKRETRAKRTHRC